MKLVTSPQPLMMPDSIGEMNICYILDGVLILYGLILTVLYCKLRFTYRKSSDEHPEKAPTDGGIYAGLTSHSTDTYETIRIKKARV